MCLGKPAQQGAHLCGERVFGGVPRAVQPPDRTGGVRVGQGVQHRQHRCGADARRDQQHGIVARPQNETAARSGQLEHRPHGRSWVCTKPLTTPSRFPFHADPVLRPPAGPDSE